MPAQARPKQFEAATWSPPYPSHPVESSPATKPEALDRPVMFLHIPKTAGTSFIGTLRNIFGHHRLQRLVSIDESTTGEIGRLLSERPDNLSCLTGHIPFHMIAPWQAQCSVFTVLRHPVSRLMSLYRFIQRHPADEQRRLGLRTGFTFKDFITSRHPELFTQIHNGMTRMLCGDQDFNTPASPRFWAVAPSPQTTRAALLTLDSIDFGLTEDMTNTMRIARAAWGIPYDLDTGHENVTNPTAAGPDVECAFEIVSRNAMDLVLYQRAADLFASRCAYLETNPVTSADCSTVFIPALGEEIAIGAIPGLQGLHEVESSGIAWLDSTQPTRIHFGLAAPAARVRLYGYAIRGDYPIDEIIVELNGAALVTHVRRANDFWFTLETDPVGLRQPLNVLSIRPPYFVPARYADPGSCDPRSLSIALAKVAFEP
jgi:hypothetical protein